MYYIAVISFRNDQLFIIEELTLAMYTRFSRRLYRVFVDFCRNPSIDPNYQQFVKILPDCPNRAYLSFFFTDGRNPNRVECILFVFLFYCSLCKDH